MLTVPSLQSIETGLKTVYLPLSCVSWYPEIPTCLDLLKQLGQECDLH